MAKLAASGKSRKQEKKRGVIQTNINDRAHSGNY